MGADGIDRCRTIFGLIVGWKPWKRERAKIYYRDWECGTRIGAGMTMPTTFWVTFRWSGLKFLDSSWCNKRIWLGLWNGTRNDTGSAPVFINHTKYVHLFDIPDHESDILPLARCAVVRKAEPFGGTREVEEQSLQLIGDVREHLLYCERNRSDIAAVDHQSECSRVAVIGVERDQQGHPEGCVLCEVEGECVVVWQVLDLPVEAVRHVWMTGIFMWLIGLSLEIGLVGIYGVGGGGWTEIQGKSHVLESKY